MRGMNVNRHVSARLILLSLLASACATQPGPRTREIDFVQGCWVQPNSPNSDIPARLSLTLNEEDAVYAGSLDRAASAGGNLSLSFSGDGASAITSAIFVPADGSDGYLYGSASFTRDTTAGPNDRGRFHLAVFRSDHFKGETLVVEASKDRLKLSSGTIAQGPLRTLFDGEPDTCD